MQDTPSDLILGARLSRKMALNATLSLLNYCNWKNNMLVFYPWRQITLIELLSLSTINKSSIGHALSGLNIIGRTERPEKWPWMPPSPSPNYWNLKELRICRIYACFLSLKTNYFVRITLFVNNQQIINWSCSQCIDYDWKNWTSRKMALNATLSLFQSL